MAVGCQSRPLVHGDAMRVLWVWGANLAGTQRQSHRRRVLGMNCVGVLSKFGKKVNVVLPFI